MKRSGFLLSIVGAASAVALQCFGFRRKIEQPEPPVAVEFELQQRMVRGEPIFSEWSPNGYMNRGKWVWRMAPVGLQESHFAQGLSVYPEFSTPEEAEKHFQSLA